MNEPVVPNNNLPAQNEKTVNRLVAIAGLLLNFFVIPGLGTMVGGDVDKGLAQAVLFLISIPLCWVLIGVPIMIFAWLWALFSSIEQIRRWKNPT
jgi:TM2 domain-containing membrane protein YozV